ncbi:MAG: hypothetical protein ACQESR_20590 [Planctomycetota bacterium]
MSVDRRSTNDRRSGQDRRRKNEPVPEERRAGHRRQGQRRRQIDPTTCERDYSDEEIEFMQALDAYKRANGRMFPTCSEILEVVREMGYVRLPRDEESAAESDVGEQDNDCAAAGKE